jgi:amidase
MMYRLSWQDRAAAKVAETASKIPPQWRISEEGRERAKEQRNLTGPFIESFLSDSEALIIRLDSLALVEKIATRSLTSLEVAEAYCKTAAIAHQIVKSSSKGPRTGI